MRLRKRLQRISENVLVAIGMAVLPFLPRRVIVSLSRLLGFTTSFIPMEARRIALANMDIVFGETRSKKEKRRLLASCYAAAAVLVLDFFWFSRHSNARLKKYVVFDDSTKVYFETSPMVAVTFHLGNWEVLGQAGASSGNPCSSVATPLPNSRINELTIGYRQSTGQRIIPRSGAVRGMLRELKNGNRVALLLDQNILPEEGGEFVTFFNRQVPISGMAVRLAERTGVPLVFMYCVLRPDGYYEARAKGPVFPADWQNDSATGNQLVAAELEELVRSYPEHWMWTYKRWKFVLPEEPREQYPYYARPYNPKS